MHAKPGRAGFAYGKYLGKLLRILQLLVKQT